MGCEIISFECCSSLIIAIASPIAKAAVVLVVGARSNGQASSEIPVSILIWAFLAMKDSCEPVMEKYLQPKDLRKGKKLNYFFTLSK